MSKTSKVFWILLISVVLYAGLPLFGLMEKWQAQQRATEAVGESSLQNTVTDTAREVMQKVESSFGLSSGCSEPLHYAIGNVDPRFGIGKDELKADMLKAEAVWERSAQKDLLQYDERSDFKINLVFDERQMATLKSKELEEKLGEVQSLQKGLSKEYDALSSQYEKKKAAYDESLKKYRAMSDEYERQVEYWNDRGGAPEKEYADLQRMRTDLNALADSLEQRRKDLNDTVDRLNALANREKKAVSGYNKDVATYEDKYGGEKEFDQGVYTGKEINIYQFSGREDLVLVLAHELGHALGMEHVENPKSVMYYLMSKQDLGHPAPTPEDLAALSGVCQ